MPDLTIVPETELDRIRAADVSDDETLAIVADACRLKPAASLLAGVVQCP